MGTKGNITYSGVGFNGLLAIVFIVLKLTKVIAWSWWLVLAPLWLPIFVSACILVSYIVVTLIVKLKK